MIWLLLAVVTRFFWALCNVADQYVSRYVGASSTMAVVVLQSLLSLPFILLTLVCIGPPQHFFADRAWVWVLAGTGLGFLGLFPYLKALQLDEARNVAPLHEMTPVFVTLLAFGLFQERMTETQMLGAALVVAAGFLFVWDFNVNRLKGRLFLLMAASALMFSLSQLIMRHLSLQIGVWELALGYALASFLQGFVLLLILPSTGRALIASFRQGGRTLVLAAAGSEVCGRLAAVCLLGAFAAAPTAGHVAALSGTQPVFVFVIAFVLGRAISHHYAPLKWDRDLKLKLGLLGVIIAGIVLLQS